MAGALGIATLLPDSGAAACEQEFFRCAEFLGAEGVTHSLLVESGDSRAAVPVVVRKIPDTELADALSPYGYPGAAQTGAPIDASAVDWSETGLVSLFIRDRVHGDPCFADPTQRTPILVSDPSQKRKSRMSDRQQIRRNEAAGYVVRTIAGPEAGRDEVEGLHAVYLETMQAVEASERYLFDRAYFGRLLAAPLSRLFIVDGPQGEIAAAAIAVHSDGAVHYYLSGTAEAHRRESPSKNLIVAVTDYAEAEGLPMSLGGGLTAGDPLEQFKRGFANSEVAYRTHEIVCDRLAYDELAAGRDAGGFFPAYRA